MSTVTEIKTAIEQLDAVDLAQLSKWFDEYLADAWDKQIERDVKAGKLDHLKDEISRERAKGKLIDFP